MRNPRPREEPLQAEVGPQHRVPIVSQAAHEIVEQGAGQAAAPERLRHHHAVQVRLARGVQAPDDPARHLLITVDGHQVAVFLADGQREVRSAGTAGRADPSRPRRGVRAPGSGCPGRRRSPFPARRARGRGRPRPAAPAAGAGRLREGQPRQGVALVRVVRGRPAGRSAPRCGRRAGPDGGTAAAATAHRHRGSAGPVSIGVAEQGEHGQLALAIEAVEPDQRLRAGRCRPVGAASGLAARQRWNRSVAPSTARLGR